MSFPGFWIRHALLPLLTFAVLAILIEGTGLDLRLSDAWYDAAVKAFPYRHAWWADDLLHDRGRDLVGLVVLAALVIWGAAGRGARWALLDRWRPWRRRALYLALTVLLSAGAAGVGKAFSDRHCPWDVDRYNGHAPYAPLFTSLPQEVEPGHCFPSSHAATGFGLLGLYFVFLDRSRRAAWVGLGIGLGVGGLFSFAQLVRGAHFLSHDLWSAALCWAIALALYKGAFRGDLSDADPRLV
ncbi:MAG TPA: PAP2 family protein [Acidobacteria bacterium]|nr:PAP2 family protein [Acidobacteriota bacterium]